VRAAPALTPIDSTTVPLAPPLWPDAIAIHAEVLTADQEQPVSVVIPTDTWPPLAAIVLLGRLSANVHGAPAWLTATCCDPTTIAPARDDGAGFAATENGTTASPCPACAPAIDTHDDVVEVAAIDQVQSREADTVTEPEPPVGPNDEGVLLTVTLHLSADGATRDDEVVEEVQPESRAPSASAQAKREEHDRMRSTRACTDARASPARAGAEPRARHRAAENVFRSAVIQALRFTPPG
jgi:hypothetical protein